MGQTYSVGADKGFLVVAYPNQDKDTEFGFNYWLEASLKSEEGTEVTNGSENESKSGI